MSIKLWLDDLRPAPAGWVLVNTVDDLVAQIAANRLGIEWVSLDHDLGDYEARGGNGRAAARHILRLAVAREPRFRARVHSANHHHGVEMQAILRQAYELWGIHEPVYWVCGDEISPPVLPWDRA